MKSVEKSMAGDWLKLRHDLPEDPAVLGIASATGLEEDCVVGKLHRLWSWADKQTLDGNAPAVTEAFVDRYVGAPGFARAMSTVGWLIITSEGITFPNFDTHISETAKSRALTARRAAKHRAQSNATAVTKSARKAHLEKRREEKSKKTTSSNKVVGGNDVPIPTELDTPRFREAWAAWLAFRREERFSVKPQAIKAQLTKLAAWGPDDAVEALTASIAGGWKGLFEPKGRNDRQATSGKSVRPSGRVHHARSQ
jgi:hypothetical protein